MPRSVTAFLDTNVLLHFPPPTEVLWAQITNADTVKLVLCLPVVHELDRLKDHESLAQRAKDALSFCWRRQGQDIDPEGRVSVHLYVWPKLDDASSARDGDVSIVRCVLDYKREHPDEDVIVVTDDYGMLLRCQASGIDARRASDKLARLEHPARAYTDKGKRPDIVVSILNQKSPSVAAVQPFRFSTDRSLLLPRSVDDYLAEARKEVDGTGWHRPEHQTVQRYFSDLEAWLKAEQQVAEEGCYTIPLQVVIGNVGNLIAQEVDVWIRFDPPLKAIIYGYSIVGEREKPIPLRTGLQGVKSRTPLATHVPANLGMIHSQVPYGFWMNTEEVHFNFHRLLPNDPPQIHREFFITPIREQWNKSLSLTIRTRVINPAHDSTRNVPLVYVPPR